MKEQQHRRWNVLAWKAFRVLAVQNERDRETLP